MNGEWDDRSQNKRAKQWLAITVVVKHRPAIAHIARLKLWSIKKVIGNFEYKH